MNSRGFVTETARDEEMPGVVMQGRGMITGLDLITTASPIARLSRMKSHLICCSRTGKELP
jgi:hypothetical protein